MNDLPSQILLQQAHARPVSGEDLETLGKHAANKYGCGECGTLTEAVVEVVKHAGLVPEQVKRVVEFDNQNAYLTKFKKASASKYIHFDGGPADPSEVLKDLNDGGGGTVFDQGSFDYAAPPPTVKTAGLFSKNLEALGLEKTAGAALHDPVEAAYERMWETEHKPVAYAQPLHETEQLWLKLGGAKEHVASEVSSLEFDYAHCTEQLYENVKAASLDGTPLGHVVQAWCDVTPGEGYVKAAFAAIGPRLVEEGVFETFDGVASSLEKTAASFAMVNHEHPLVTGFASFCDCLTKLAATRQAYDRLDAQHGKIDTFLKKATAALPLARKVNQGLSKAWQGVKGVAESASVPAGEIAGALVGPNTGKAVQWGVKHIPHAAGLLAGKEFYDRAIKYGPGQIPLRYLKSHVPGTREYYIREMNLQQSPGLM